MLSKLGLNPGIDSDKSVINAESSKEQQTHETLQTNKRQSHRLLSLNAQPIIR